jgi:hypothetical protein
MSEYSKDYWQDAISSFRQLPEAMAEYSVSVEPSFKMPPVLDVVRFLQNPVDEDLQDMITKKCIAGTTLNVCYDGKPVGTGITVPNDSSFSWGLFTELTQHPLAMIMLRESAGAFVIKNSMPLRKNAQTTVAKK